MRSKFWNRLDALLRHGAETPLALARSWADLPAAPAIGGKVPRDKTH